MVTYFALTKLVNQNHSDNWKDHSCVSNDTKYFDYVTEEDGGTTAFIIDSIGSSLSFLALTGIACIILSDTKLQAHPNMLIAKKCMCDAFIYYQFFNRYMVCGHQWNNLADRFYARTV